MSLLGRRRGTRGFAMALTMVVMVVMTVISTTVLTASYGELRSAQRSFERTEGRIHAAAAAEEIFSRIAGQANFLEPITNTAVSWNHPGVGSTVNGRKWARLDQPAVACDPADFTLDCYHVQIRSLGATAGSPLSVDVTVRHSCNGDEASCSYQRYEQRIRRRQFFDFLYFHQFSTRDPQDYLETGSFNRSWALANCADRYAARSNGPFGARPADCTSVAFQGEGAARDEIKGPVYTADDYITVCGNPNFTQDVLVGGAGFTSGGVTRVWRTSTGTTCTGSPTLPTTVANAGVLSMPSSATTFARASAAANLRLTAAVAATPVVVRLSTVASGATWLTRAQVTGSTSDGTFTLPSPEAVVTVDGSADVAGTVAGRLSVFARNDLIIGGDLRYQRGDNTGNGFDVLGLTSGGGIVIRKSSGTRTISALMLSLSGSIRTENWRIPDSPFNTSWPAPTLRMFGAMAAKYQGMFGGFDIATARLVSGYRKDFTFDSRPSGGGLMPPLLISPVGADWERLDITELPGSPSATVPPTPTAPPTTAPPTTAPPTTAPRIAPGAPTGVTAQPGRASATVRWTIGPSGSSPITAQYIHVYSGTRKVTTVPVSATATSFTVTGLSRRTYYSFTVSANNAVGPGPESAKSAVVRTS